MLYGPTKLKVKERHRRAIEMLTAVGLGKRTDHHPNQLSGGQQQRVAIARALVTNPSILLADEPTGNLDTRTSIEVMGIFQRLNIERGITVLLITHEMDIAQYGTRIIQCRDGPSSRITKCSTAETPKKNSQRYQKTTTNPHRHRRCRPLQSKPRRDRLWVTIPFESNPRPSATSH